MQSALVGATTGRVPTDPVLLRMLSGSRDVMASERIAAYRANVTGAHLQALDQAFPVTRVVLGPRYWRQLLENELTLFASRSPDLNSYGAFVPGLLADCHRNRPELAELPYLAELAELEWTVHRARFAPDDPEFEGGEFAGLAAASQANARLVPSSALRMMDFEYPVDDIWLRHNSLAVSGHDATGTVYCCVHRSGRFEFAVSRLLREEFDLLRVLPKFTIGELHDALDDDAIDGFARKIFEWIQRRWIVGFEMA